MRNASTRLATGWCLEPHDLVVSQLVAGRDKDEDYARVASRHALVGEALLIERSAELTAAVRELVRARISRAATSA